MRAIDDWENIEASGNGGGGHDVPTGAYVCVVQKVFDDPDFTNRNGENKPRIGILWDIAEGEHMGTFSDDWAMEDNHHFAHLQWFYYESLPGFFKGFVQAIEQSNGISWNYGDVDAFKSRLFGAGIRHEFHTYDGQDKSRLEISYFCDAQEVRDGKKKAPKDKDNRDKVPASTAAPAAAYDTAEVPF